MMVELKARKKPDTVKFMRLPEDATEKEALELIAWLKKNFSEMSFDYTASPIGTINGEVHVRATYYPFLVRRGDYAIITAHGDLESATPEAFEQLYELA